MPPQSNTTSTADNGAEPDLLTVKECAAVLRSSRQFVYSLLNTGALPYLEVGGKRLIEREALLELLASCRRTGGRNTPPSRVPQKPVVGLKHIKL